ncbi:hypothetical protein PFICI_10173 [Pestalotiopsis fici W106-1]|uniref:Uncharacterized protein n=1 Tax=Pestalotiopsis fici (strain W106-1 / CGMCC3.15140) TaxID=1229662 RepID=W3WYZ2_PESFW|nr:uncharacterized protein PFICI_10173 [Pestalotiopsis fici W106-1]ETS78111.1 hypothetical protein PFICI_10173 [Pestalotiopsis fici W106-1]
MEVGGYAFVAGGGKACCYAFAREGATGVVVADIDIDAAEETASEIRALATHPEFLAEAVQLDLGAEESIQSAISYTTAIFGRVDYSIHCNGMPNRTCDLIAQASFVDLKRLLELDIHRAVV